jgi:hypothetical protein
LTERQQPERETGKPSDGDGVSIARAVKIAVVVFGLALGVLVVAALMTEGAPHAPFEYGVGE